MKEAMKKWLEHRQITFDPNTANSICNRFELDGEKADECLGLCYQLESDKITQAEFTGGLCVLTGKEPEEVMGVLKGMETKPLTEGEEKVKDYVIDKLGELPKEVEYYKIVGGYGGIVKYKGRLYRMSEVMKGAVHAAHLGMLANVGLIKITRLSPTDPRYYEWQKMYSVRKPLPVFGIEK